MVSNIMLTLAFLAAVLAVYYAVPRKGRWGVLLAASYGFYMSANPYMAFLIGGTTIWSFLTGIGIQQSKTNKSKRGWLLACILPLIGVLFLFKYFNFFSESVAQLFNTAGLATKPLTLQLVMPLGISYYTFKILSYVIDIYRGKQKAETHPGYFAVYVSFFPQILSGPIERSEVLLPQLREGLVFEKELFGEGLWLIVLGLFKKIVIANRLSSYVDLIFADPQGYPGLAAVMAAFLFSVQIYCDFSGYSDIAIGMSNTMGIRCNRNFNHPYFATDIKDFWSRWHISLSGWLKDYVYISLGGNRVSKVRKNFNIMATFLVSGLWHGDNWTYIVWGAIHGLWNMGSSPKKSKEPGTFGRILRTGITFLGVTLAWIFFRASSLADAGIFLRRIFTGFQISLANIQASVLPFTGDNTCVAYFLTVAFFILMLVIYEWQQVYGKKALQKEGKRCEQRTANIPTSWFAFMLVSVLLFGVFGNSSFLYAQF